MFPGFSYYSDSNIIIPRVLRRGLTEIHHPWMSVSSRPEMPEGHCFNLQVSCPSLAIVAGSSGVTQPGFADAPSETHKPDEARRYQIQGRSSSAVAGNIFHRINFGHQPRFVDGAKLGSALPPGQLHLYRDHGLGTTSTSSKRLLESLSVPGTLTSAIHLPSIGFFPRRSTSTLRVPKFLVDNRPNPRQCLFDKHGKQCLRGL
jgi:hypothetical protein